jgi:hypothetical protein
VSSSPPQPPTPAGTSLDVLLTHGLDRGTVDRLRAVFPRTEVAAATLFRHRDNACDPSSCPWHADGPLADQETEPVLDAITAWCAVGWLERSILRPDERHPD